MSGIVSLPFSGTVSYLEGNPFGIDINQNISITGTIIASLGSITGGSGYTPSGIISTLGTITAGSGYTDGTYTAVPLTGGTGSSAQATIIVKNGAVVQVTVTNTGSSYTIGDSLSVSSASALGGTGSGYSQPIATTIYTGISLTGGAGSGAAASIKVSSGGAVNVVTLSNRGTGYLINDTLSANTSAIGGTGSGFSIPVSKVGGTIPNNVYFFQGNPSPTSSGVVAQLPNDGLLSYWHMTVNNDGLDTESAASGSPTALMSLQLKPGDNRTASRNTLFANCSVVGKPATADVASANNVAVGANTNISVNQGGTSSNPPNSYYGSVFGSNPNVFTGGTATNLSGVVGEEVDIAVVYGTNCARKVGIQIVQTTIDRLRGEYTDAGLLIANQNSASQTTWSAGVQFGSQLDNFPAGTDSTLIKAVSRTQGGISSAVALFGVDFSQVTFTASGAPFRAPQITISVSSTPGSAGSICWDSNFVYVCTATDFWKRASLSSF